MDMRDKAKTGNSRKSYKFEEEMEAICEGRHDIFPPLVVGSSIEGVVKTDNAKRSASSDEESSLPATNSVKRRKRMSPAKSEPNEPTSDLMKVISKLTDHIIDMDKRNSDTFGSLASTAQKCFNLVQGASNQK